MGTPEKVPVTPPRNVVENRHEPNTTLWPKFRIMLRDAIRSATQCQGSPPSAFGFMAPSFFLACRRGPSKFSDRSKKNGRRWLHRFRAAGMQAQAVMVTQV